jgi:hypothetical protein
MDDLQAFVFGRGFKFIDFGVVDERLTTAGKSFCTDSVHNFLNFSPTALVPFAADQSVFYIKPLFVSRISPGERGALPTLLKPLQELDGW